MVTVEDRHKYSNLKLILSLIIFKPQGIIGVVMKINCNKISVFSKKGEKKETPSAGAE